MDLNRKKVASLGTAPIVSKSVHLQPSYVVAVRRDLNAPKNVKYNENVIIRLNINVNIRYKRM